MLPCEPTQADQAPATRRGTDAVPFDVLSINSTRYLPGFGPVAGRNLAQGERPDKSGLTAISKTKY